MRIGRIEYNARCYLATSDGEHIRAWIADDAMTSLDALIGEDSTALAEVGRRCNEGMLLNAEQVHFLPPLANARKIICVGLNYRDHASEIALETPVFPTLFSRFSSSLIGHGAPLVKPTSSDQFDFEGEMAVIIGKGGRHITRKDAVGHVAAYSIFNDASVRDIQMLTPQWTAGKNFDGTGAFGPWLVTAEELPHGAAGLQLTTRLNDEVVQSASTSDMVFDVAELVHLLSGFMTLQPGDVIVSGTPAGVGMGRTPPLWMKAGDRCTVEIEGIGILSNPIEVETPIASA